MKKSMENRNIEKSRLKSESKELVYFNIVDVGDVQAELMAGDTLKLVKDFDNYADDETILVLQNNKRIGFVANSVKTAIVGTYSAGRLYDKIGEEAEAHIVIRNNGYPNIAIGGIYL